MKSYKILFAIGCIAITLIIGMIIGSTIPENTVDFNGRVTELSKNEDGTCILKAESIAGGELSFIIDSKSDLENCCDEDITVDDISAGGIVLINYRNTIFKKNEIKTVKGLTCFVGSEKANGN